MAPRARSGTSLTSLQLAKWEVMWLTKKGRVARKDCGDNLPEAQRLFLKLQAAGRKGVTLRCKNMGFGPPERFMPHEVQFTRRGKKFRATKVPMKKLNARGIWWCPYCMQMRRFKLIDHFHIHGIRVDEKRFVCPMCEVNVDNHNVKKYNPLALRIEVDLRSRRGRKKGRKRRRRLKRDE